MLLLTVANYINLNSYWSLSVGTFDIVRGWEVNWLPVQSLFPDVCQLTLLCPTGYRAQNICSCHTDICCFATELPTNILLAPLKTWWYLSGLHGGGGWGVLISITLVGEMSQWMSCCLSDAWPVRLSPSRSVAADWLNYNACSR